MIRLVFLAFTLMGVSSCQSGSNVYLKGEVTGLGRDSVYLFRWDAGRWQVTARAAVRNGAFSFSGVRPAPGFYWWGVSPQEGDLLYLSAKEVPILKGQVQELFERYTLENAKEAAEFLGLKRQLSALYRALPQQVSDTLAKKALEKRLDSLFSRAAQSPNLAVRLYAPFYRAPSYKPGSTPQSSWENLIQSVWADIALTDERLAGLPELFGRFQYTWQVALALIPEDSLLSYLSRWPELNKAPRAIQKNAIVALLAASQQSGRSDLFLSAAELFVKGFPEDERKAQLESLLSAEGSLRKGQPAPDIALPDTGGRLRKLSELRGRWVLIDFWASWCRPCRMENPNVVRLYQEYHPKGFEIFGVSLDQQREAWLRAIEQDRLTWIHVSDLKGWQNAAAQLYRVNGIPYTVLIDPEGRIVAKGLRGPALEEKLRAIYGE